MALINQLLNLIGLVLWLSWRSASVPLQAKGAGTLLSNLKPADTRRTRRWIFPLCLVALIALRPLLYAPLARLLDWTPVLSTGPVALAFRADIPERLFAFSFLSFAWSLLVFQTALMLLALLGQREDGTAGLTAWFRELAGRASRWPMPVILGFPVLLLAGCWFGIVFLLAFIGVLPPPPAAGIISVQALLIGLSIWLPMRWLLAGLLLLRFINDYVYLGEHRLWDYVRIAGRRLTRPLQWLPARIGKLDLVPLLAAAAVLGLAWASESALLRAQTMVSR